MTVAVLGLIAAVVAALIPGAIALIRVRTVDRRAVDVDQIKELWDENRRTRQELDIARQDCDQCRDRLAEVREENAQQRREVTQLRGEVAYMRRLLDERR